MNINTCETNRNKVAKILRTVYLQPYANIRIHICVYVSGCIRVSVCGGSAPSILCE